MSVIACVQFPTKQCVTDAVLDVCAGLTPVVEPDARRVWMDWTGCGRVEVLAEKLATALPCARVADERAVRYRIGIAPVRFAAGVLASDASVLHDLITTDALLRPHVQRVTRGYRATAAALPKLLARLPIALLPELSATTRTTLAALDVQTVGDLSRIPRVLLYDHIGHHADELFQWARGRDPRPVTSSYPPHRLRRRLPAHLLAAADAAHVQKTLSPATECLLEELRTTGNACAVLTVSRGEHRRERVFTPPVAAGARLRRTLLHNVLRLLATTKTAPNRAAADCIVEITPVHHTYEQTSLWGTTAPELAAAEAPTTAGKLAAGAKRRAAGAERRAAALDEIVARFEEAFGKRKPRAAIAHYEAMSEFYG